MQAAISFIAGLMIGGFFGVVIMCLLQAKRIGEEGVDEYEDC